MRRALKICRKILFWIFFIGLFLLTTVVVILNVYEDDIKQFAIDELNENLKTNVEVEDIQLSVFHDFPYASIQFDEVFIPDAYPEIESEDTMFYAKRMFFNFNIMDIYSGNYEVKRISVHDGCLHMNTAPDGQKNYDILEKRDSLKSDSDENFAFKVELLDLENFNYSYHHLGAKQHYDVDINSGLVAGDFAKDNYELEADLDLHINSLKSNAFTLLKDKDADLDLNMTIIHSQKSYLFNKGDLAVEEMPFQITGQIDSSYLDLKIHGDDMEIHDLANSLVDESLENVKTYEGEGIINFEASILGQSGGAQMPSIEADFNISGASIKEPEKDLQIQDIQFVGHYQNQFEERKEELQMLDVKMKMLNSFFEGSAVVTDFDEPILTTKMDGNINLARFHQFFNFKNVEKLAGNLAFNFDGQIQFFDPEYRAEKFKVLKSNGDFSLEKVIYKSYSDNLTYQDISGHVVLNNKDAAAKDLSIKTNKSDILLNGAMKNFVPFVEGTGSLGLIAWVESNRINLDEFLGEANKNKQGPLKMFVLPANLNVNVNLNVKELNWENHQFQNADSKVLMTGRKISLKNIKCEMLGGNIKGDLSLNNLLENGNVVDGKLKFNNVDVKKLFAEWDNFDQKSITDKHISGQAGGTIDFRLGFNSYFSIIEDKIYADSDIKISNGELNNLETMKSITEYMRSNKGLNLLLKNHIDNFEDKLLHLKFSDIENHITIKDRKITIPKMKIQTSAMDVDLFGWHDFDNMIDYHFSFRFRELKTKAEESEFGIIEDDGLGLVVYLAMFGDLDDPTYALDKDERRESIKENIAQEKQDIKAMLKAEFGLFKQDSSVKKIEEENKHEVQFIYYDEDIDENLIEEKSDTVKRNNKNKKRSIHLFDKIKAQAEKEKTQDKIEIEIDE